MACEPTRKLLEEYVLGMLNPEEQQGAEQHLAGCSECRQLLTEYREIVATLPVALGVVSPHRLPDAVKIKLLQRLDDAPAAEPIITPITTPEIAPPGFRSTANRAHPSRPIPERSLGLRQLRFALIAAGILLVLALFWSIRLNVALARERALRAEFVELVGQQQELVLEVIDSNKTTRRVLLPPASDSSAYGKVFTREGMPYVVAMAARLPAPPNGQAYHLWLLSLQATELAGVMSINQDGFGLLIYQAANTEHLYTAAQLTLQPQGSTAPTAPPVLRWQATE